jgi:hypothetical protein
MLPVQYCSCNISPRITQQKADMPMLARKCQKEDWHGRSSFPPRPDTWKGDLLMVVEKYHFHSYVCSLHDRALPGWQNSKIGKH